MDMQGRSCTDTGLVRRSSHFPQTSPIYDITGIISLPSYPFPRKHSFPLTLSSPHPPMPSNQFSLSHTYLPIPSRLQHPQLSRQALGGRVLVWGLKG